MSDQLFKQALSLHQNGQFAQAQGLYEKILAIQPGNADALHLLGVIAYQTRDHQRAVDLINKAIARYPHNATFYSNRGLALTELQQFSAAIDSYEKAIAIDPKLAEAYYNRGLAMEAFKEPDRAIASYNKAIAIKTDYAQAWSNRGNALQTLKQFEAAIASYDQAISIIPDYAQSWSNRSVALKELGRFKDAILSSDKAIAIDPFFAEAYCNRGIALKELHLFEEALSNYDQAIAIKPDYAEAFFNRGIALHELNQFDAAITSYNRAITIKADYAEAYSSRGAALHMMKQLEAAIASHNQAIAIRPDYADAFSNRGVTLQELKQFDAAIASYNHAIAIKPDHAEAFSNRGLALQELKQFDAAIASYEQAIRIRPDEPYAYYNLGNALSEIKLLDGALASYHKAFSINPDYDYLPGAYLHSKMMICDWISYDDLSNLLVSKIENREKASAPFPLLAVINSPSVLQHAASIYVEDKYPAHFMADDMIIHPRHDRIRIGYFSAEYHTHATMQLMVELFEKHDRSKFEIIAFSIGPDPQEDVMRRRIASAADRFIDVRTISDQAVATLSRELEIDIAVDLKGFTQDSRTGVFSFRAAPIQVNYLGYPGTMGAEYMDYLIADTIVVPEESQQYYSEKIVYLPNSYQVNDAEQKIADKAYTRKDSGLPKTGFVFCCFNNNYKITPATFDGWMRILERVEGSALWLYGDNPLVSENLRMEAVRRGVEADRIVFARRLPLPEHLARHRSADLFLDTFPCNAHTTASDALWAGLPLLTCIGQSFAGRVAASLLNAVHLPELITHSQEEYEAMAIELATNPEKLKKIRRKLEINRRSLPLFDSNLFARHIEAAYEAMYERYRRDLPPDHIYVQP
jgi:predicted O-linked N-acetylglucosamine transferase (SPINDLY family)